MGLRKGIIRERIVGVLRDADKPISARQIYERMANKTYCRGTRQVANMCASDYRVMKVYGRNLSDILWIVREHDES